MFKKDFHRYSKFSLQDPVGLPKDLCLKGTREILTSGIRQPFGFRYTFSCNLVAGRSYPRSYPGH